PQGFHLLRTRDIGFFDSGVGGLSVYSRFKKFLPSENTIYFGDTKNLPYGNKSKEELIGFARNILDFFKSKNVKAVVIACNTSSALAYEAIKDDYVFPIYPIIQSCAKVIACENYSRIGVFATQGTVNAGAYKKEICNYNKNIQVKEIACPNWVNIVESGNINSNASYNDIKFHVDEMLNFNPDKIILGCTHYPYLLNVLKNMLPVDKFIDPAEIFVDYIKTNINNLNIAASGDCKGVEEFYVSAKPEEFVTNAELFYKLSELPHLY
ncbi:MAG: glutamate racemase, partial [bacterium]|nr:glutamate racemase [bacterium]